MEAKNLTTMKKLLFLFLLSCTGAIPAQNVFETEVKTEVSDVSVFLKGAQISRKKQLDINPGVSLLKFTNLSPFIEGKSIQVKVNGNITVLAVNHQQNFIDELEKSEELLILEKKLETVQSKIELENAHLGIIKEHVLFLNENRDIGGKNQTLNIIDLKAASNFYSEKLTALKLEELDRNKNLEKLSEEAQNLTDQLNSVVSKKDYANGEIVLKVEAKKLTNANIELSYLVGNAGWFPSYDIRAKDVVSPISLSYKANVKQDTKINWNNVKLRFSSGNPNLSGSAPELKVYYLDYRTRPPSYESSISDVSGVVYDNDGSPLPGVNILVQGTTIGTSTDFYGRYSIVLPNSESVLVFSYVGFMSESVRVTSPVHNVYLSEDQELEEVVVTAQGIKREKKSLGYAISDKIKQEAPKSNNIPLLKIENQTTVDFEVAVPYTVKSDNKSYAVEMVNYDLPADYQYQAIPKIEKDAFLIAKISD